MRTEERDPVYNQLDGDILYGMSDGDINVYEVTLKIRPHGLLLLIKATRGREYMIAFVGGRKIDSLIRKAYLELRQNNLRWRTDRYVEKSLTRT